MRYHIIREARGLVAQFTGHCSIDDVRQAFEQIGSAPRCDALRYQIFDDLNVQAHNIIESELDEIAAIDFARHLTNLKVVYASVAVEPRIIALIQHFIRINAHPERLRRCASVQAARQWIASVCP